MGLLLWSRMMSRNTFWFLNTRVPCQELCSASWGVWCWFKAKQIWRSVAGLTCISRDERVIRKVSYIWNSKRTTYSFEWCFRLSPAAWWSKVGSTHTEDYQLNPAFTKTKCIILEMPTPAKRELFWGTVIALRSRAWDRLGGTRVIVLSD